MAPPIMCAALDAHPSTPSFGVVPGLQRNGTRSSLTTRARERESRFNLSSDDNRVRVWRTRGDCLNPAFALQRHTAPTAGVMVWVAIAFNTRLPLVLIRGTMTDQRYAHDILQPHVLLLMQGIPEAIFQQNNAQPHTASVSKDCLHSLTSLPFHVRSPDLFPIEHIWDLSGCPALWGCGSPVVKVSDHDRHVRSLSPVPLKTRRVEQRYS
ncbi:transposable element Tcb2 transposase [Trichonephila clavipes]|nr:transposable element Tcb2 transposase [Trichonephila clavipes]